MARLSFFSILSGVVTFVTLSNVLQFHHVVLAPAKDGGQEGQKIPSVQAWLAVAPPRDEQEEKVETAKILDKGSDKKGSSINGNKKDDDNAAARNKNQHALLAEDPNDPLPPWPYTDPADVRVLFVHVGKAGGMSLNGKLKTQEQTRKFLACRRKYTTPQEFHNDTCRQTPGAGAVAKLTLRLFGHLHRWEPSDDKASNWLIQNTNVLLFTLRDPVDRLVSAFNYARWFIFEYKSPNKNKKYDPRAIEFFKTCFADMQECAGAIDPRNTTLPRHPCAESALPVVQGRTQLPDLDHLYYNYRYYTDRVHWDPEKLHTEDRTLVVVRTEHMWTDVARLEAYVGGKVGRFLDPKIMNYKLTHGSEGYAVNKGLTTSHARAICCILATTTDTRIVSVSTTGHASGQLAAF